MDDPFVKGVTMAVIGAGLGVFFFGGLWLTLRQLPVSQHPYLLTLGSAIVRTTVVITGIWYFSGGNPVSIGAGLGGFITLQLLATCRGAMSVHSEKN